LTQTADTATAGRTRKMSHQEMMEWAERVVASKSRKENLMESVGRDMDEISWELSDRRESKKDFLRHRQQIRDLCAYRHDLDFLYVAMKLLRGLGKVQESPNIERGMNEWAEEIKARHRQGEKATPIEQAFVLAALGKATLGQYLDGMTEEELRPQAAPGTAQPTPIPPPPAATTPRG
jgi:hypothetical protein